jgi:hypothetical protein
MHNTVDQRITAAAEYLDGARRRKVGELPPSLLVRECAELRRLLGQVLDVIGEHQAPGATEVTGPFETERQARAASLYARSGPQGASPAGGIRTCNLADLAVGVSGLPLSGYDRDLRLHPPGVPAVCQQGAAMTTDLQPGIQVYLAILRPGAEIRPTLRLRMGLNRETTGPFRFGRGQRAAWRSASTALRPR